MYNSIKNDKLEDKLMTDKPTYEELERRVKALEKEAGKRKKTDGVFYQSKEKYQNILSSIEEGYYEVDLVGNLTLFNDSLCKIYGYARDELMGMNNRDYMTTETAKKTYEVFNRVYRTGEPTKIFDWEFIKKDGTKVDVEISVSLIRNPKGQAIGFRGIVRDIRERKHIEAALQKAHNELVEVNKRLKQKNTELNSFINNVPDMAWLKDSESRFIAVNETFSEAVEMSPGSLINQTCEVCFGKEAAKNFREDDLKVMKGKKQVLIEEKIKDPKNNEVWLETIKSPIFDESGKVSGTVGIARDITHRKQAQEELVKSKSMLKAVIKNLPFDVFAIDRNNRYILQNETCKKNWGNLIGKSPEDTAVDKQTKDLWLKNNRLAFSGETVTGEVVYDRLDGGKNFYYNIVSPIFDGKKILGIIGVLIDISNRKYAEEAIRESESKLNAMLASIGDHISMLDKDLTILWANEIAEKIFGNDIIGKKCYEVYHKRTEPCEPYPCITLRAFQDGKIHKHDTQVIDKDGEKIFFHCTANVALEDKGGKPTSVIEISRDITEKILVENALQKAKDGLERQVKERTRELNVQKSNIEEANIALQVLLEKRQEDKKDLEDNVLTNVKELIVLYIEKIKKTKLDDQQKAILSIVESNLNEIISPFTRKVSLKYLNLTPTEIQVANLIRHGSNSKEIAEFMGLSPRTIYNHRKNIRKKFGLENKKTNLRSHLLSTY
jgi:PAS domain S-box-containing protein